MFEYWLAIFVFFTLIYVIKVFNSFFVIDRRFFWLKFVMFVIRLGLAQTINAFLAITGLPIGGIMHCFSKTVIIVSMLIIKSSIFVHFIDKIRAKKGKSSPSSERYVTQESFWLRLLTVHIFHFNSIIKR